MLSYTIPLLIGVCVHYFLLPPFAAMREDVRVGVAITLGFGVLPPRDGVWFGESPPCPPDGSGLGRLSETGLFDLPLFRDGVRGSGLATSETGKDVSGEEFIGDSCSSSALRCPTGATVSSKLEAEADSFPVLRRFDDVDSVSVGLFPREDGPD